MFVKQDNTFQELRERSVQQWLYDMSNHEDLVVRGGVRATEEYIDGLKKQIEYLESQCKLKDKYLKKIKDKSI